MTPREIKNLIKDIKYDIRVRQLAKQYHKADELKYKLKLLYDKLKNGRRN